jgi:3-hydroxybutyryl-CoA dehydrogenase
MQNLQQIGVVGFGQMGSGIAQVCAQSGYKTIVFDENKDALNSNLSQLILKLEKLASQNKYSIEALDNFKTNISVAHSLDDFSNCSLVIEAIVEKVEAKMELFATLDKITQRDCIFASNTSSISITKLASATNRSEHFIGIHFMNPVPLMKLVEIIPGLNTSQSTLDMATSLVKSLGKDFIIAPDIPGFLINRVLVPMINEAFFLLEQGVKPEEIDKGVKLGLNHPMGILELADFVGLDTILYLCEYLHQELGEDKYRPSHHLRKLVNAGRLGKKAGKGVYNYQS